jgi:multiple sugar transport system permease protein/sn-glycerol 3-phosphate transport system permease protein
LAAGKEWILFILFMLPNLVLFGLFSFWPMIENVRLSTQRWDMISPIRLSVGLDNYRYLVENASFHRVLVNTAYFTVAAVGLSLLLGLIVALLLNQPLRFREGARAVVFAPTLLSGAAIGIVWSYIFDPRFGLLAQVLDWVSISSPDWLNRPNWSMPANHHRLRLKNRGFAAVIFLGRSPGDPRDLYDAAKIDGANMWCGFARSPSRCCRRSPFSAGDVDPQHLPSVRHHPVMTQGDRSTRPIRSAIRLRAGIRRPQRGTIGAASLVLFVLMMIITLVQLRFSDGGCIMDNISVRDRRRASQAAGYVATAIVVLVIGLPVGG